MARLPRFVIPGQPQHVIQRGNNREGVFVAEQDYLFYLAKLKDFAKNINAFTCPYVLMTNHVHLLIKPHIENGISRLIQSLGRYYVQYFNNRYRLQAPFRARNKTTVLDSEQYLSTCSR